MSDTDGKKPLGLGGAPRSGQVKQSFSHGRTKSVVVEVKRKLTVVPNKGAAPTPGTGAAVATSPRLGDPSKRPAGISDAEMERRMSALRAAKAREADDATKRVEDEKAREEDRQRKREENEIKEREQREAETAARAKAAEEERLRAEAVAAAQAIEEARQASAGQARTEPRSAGAPSSRAPSRTAAAAPVDDAVSRGPASAKPGLPPRRADREREDRERAASKAKGEEGRRAGKLTLSDAVADEGGRQRSMAAMKRKQEKARLKALGMGLKPEKQVRDVQLPETIVVSELANRMAERGADVVKSLMKMGMMVTMNQAIDADTAELVIEEFGHRAVRVTDADVEQAIDTVKDKSEDLMPRPPIVTIMGHVDHGKTSLLDAIRHANVVSGEAGGITQHIGAYQVKTANGQLVTFLDTPGHAAFTSMRSRGAHVTDIVILVVAADDAVMPQTVEAIAHAKAAKVPMIVAINKIDKYEANPTKVRTDLLQHSVVVEEMSGDVQDVEVSAKTGKGIDNLLEAIALQAEILELRSNPNRQAAGAVIEAKLDSGRGPVATVLVQNGTLRKGDIFVVGQQWGKVRALINDKGETVTEAGPSVPVEVLGLSGTPHAGDTEQLMAKAKADLTVAELPIIVKADVQGSAEAIVQALEKIGNDEVRVRVLHSGVGAITDTDVGLAEASKAPIIGFNVRANATARASATQKGVDVRYYSIIYDLVDDIKKAASGLLKAEIRETFIGYATIKEVFKITGIGNVAGCLVTEGVARRSAGVRLLRDDVVIHEGTLKTLKRFKDEVKDVPMGQECGMAFERYEDIRSGDVIEIFEREEVQRTLA